MQEAHGTGIVEFDRFECLSCGQKYNSAKEEYMGKAAQQASGGPEQNRKSAP